MRRDQGFMTPVSTLFMVMVAAPYLWVRLGRLSSVVLLPVIAYTIVQGYRHYQKKADDNALSYADALEEDLPDMSPLHFLLFMLLAFPLLMFISGGEWIVLSGVAIAWLAYAVYYYGFRNQKGG